MRGRSLTLCAIAFVLLANALALLHAARNRWGEPDAEVMLTERELSLVRPEDESGVLLRLKWSGPSFPRPDQNRPPGPHENWLGPAKLSELGFDCSVPPNAREAPDHYKRLPVRKCYVALRLEQPDPGIDGAATRLFAVDAALDAAELRRRHSDRHSVAILPAAISVRLEGRGERELRTGAQEARVRGWISYLPRDISVPRPFSDLLRPLPVDKPRFSVRLRFGTCYEPWVVGISTP